MRHILNFRAFFLLLSFSIFAISCKKVSGPEPLGDAGNVFVKVIGGGTPPQLIKKAIDFLNAPSTVSFSLQRIVAKPSDLEKKMTIKVLDDTAAVNFFNRDTVSTNPNATNPDKLFLEHMPATWYTVGANTTKTGGRGGVYTVEMNLSEFIKDLNLIIPNATLLDPSTTYALGFTIISVDADGKVANSKSVIMTIGAKNIYDGVYDDIFTNYHPSSNPGYTGATVEVYMVTTGANKVKIYSPDIGGFYNPAILNGNLSAFSGQEPEYTINTTTNAVTVQNTASGAVTFYNMNSSFNSRYDPATKTIYAKFGYNNPGGIFNPATTREWTQELRYKRPR